MQYNPVLNGAPLAWPTILQTDHNLSPARSLQPAPARLASSHPGWSLTQHRDPSRSQPLTCSSSSASSSWRSSREVGALELMAAGDAEMPEPEPAGGSKSSWAVVSPSQVRSSQQGLLPSHWVTWSWTLPHLRHLSPPLLVPGHSCCIRVGLAEP